MLTLSEKSFLTDFLRKFISNQDEVLYELAEKINYQERGKLLALCYAAQKDKANIMTLMETVQDFMDLKGIKYE